MVRIECTCPDGTPFPVELATADDADRTWYLDLEHAPRPLTTLAEAVRDAGTDGATSAWADAGVGFPVALRRARPRAHGFQYAPGFDEDLTPGDAARRADEVEALAARHGGSWGCWQDWCVPQLRADVATLAQAAPSTPFADLARTCEHAIALTSIVSLLTRLDFAAVAGSCAAVVGDRAAVVTHLLAQGSVNRTTDAEDALARVARLRREGAPAAAVDAATADALAEFGGRAVSWSIDAPTLSERPDLLGAHLAALDAVGGGGAASGGERGRGRAAARRDRLAAEVRAALAGDERAAFDQRLEQLATFVPIREGRAHWQLLAYGALRGAVHRRGEQLVGEGVLDRVDEVLHLTPAEYDDPEAHDAAGLRTTVRARRAEHARWLDVVPPRTIGRAPPAPTSAAPSMTGPVASAPTTTGDAGARRLVGIGGSPGRVRGTARVIVDLDDADRLRAGDVLVARGTSPLWTPLFAIAAAVVTDSGDLVSHVSIAAREHGIPCVAGAHDATRLVPDGATITVDGDEGVVLLDP